jgi:hypothetical protein
MMPHLETAATVRMMETRERLDGVERKRRIAAAGVRCGRRRPAATGGFVARLLLALKKESGEVRPMPGLRSAPAVIEGN